MRLVLALLLLALLVLPGGADEPTGDSLRQALLDAQGDSEIAAALDALAARVGAEGGFGDLGELADFLAALPEPKATHPVVALRRAWALLAARRGGEAIPLLEQAIGRGAQQPAATAYLADALRQAGRHSEALAKLAEAAKTGFDVSFLKDSAVKAAFDLRQAGAPHADEGEPAYVAPFAEFLAVVPDALLEATLARWLLEDRTRHAPDDGPRSRVFATAAARHALAAVVLDPEVEGARVLVLEAAEAARAADVASEGATARFDLLAWAVRLGAPNEDGVYLRSLVLLAEAALGEHRYALAGRLARRRLGYSDSPAARRVLDALPPQYGD